MKVTLLVAGAMLAANLAVGPVSPAEAGSCTFVRQTQIIRGQVVVSLVKICEGAADEATATATSSAPVPPRDTNVDALCVNQALSIGADPFAFCDLPPDAALPVITPGLVAAAFAALPLPASKLEVQPTGGRTLVNFDTNFFTTNEPFNRTVALLGQQVELRIRATGFAWQFGDGESLSTTSPGSAYPNLEITHRYLEVGTIAPTVDTTYSADYRINGGPWAPVPGSATIPGETAPVDVVPAAPQLVG